MNIKKLLPIGVLCGIVIIAFIFVITNARKEEDHSLDKLSSTGTNTTEQTTTEVSSTEAEIQTEGTEAVEVDTNTEEPVPEPDSEELAKIDEIDKKNKEIFAKNKEIPTGLAYAGIDVSSLMFVPNYQVGGFWYHDEVTREQYFVYADCDAETALSCLFDEPIVSISDPEEQPGGACDVYYVKTASHEYEIMYDKVYNEIYHVEKDNDLSVTIMIEADANDYIKRFLSDDTASTSGCGCGCGSDDSGSSCTTGSECGGNSSDCGV